MKAMLCGEKPQLLGALVRFLMECDEALAMQGDYHLNPLYAHSPVRIEPEAGNPHCRTRMMMLLLSRGVLVFRGTLKREIGGTL